jgi:hypothetical protein
MESAQASKTKAELAGDVLFRLGDMHSHYDIEAPDGGFALVRTFEIDEQMLGGYGVPDEQEWGWTKTLDEMHDRILDPDFMRGPFPGDAPEPTTKAGDLARGGARLELAAEARQTPEAAAILRQAWQQPAFSYETIKADPWTAVYLAVPENASSALLNVAYNAAGRCIEALGSRTVPYADAVMDGPLIPQDTEADNLAIAEMRRDELHPMLFPIGAPAAERERREHIAALEGMAVRAAQEMLEGTPKPHRPGSELSPYGPRELSMPDNYYPTDDDLRAVGEAFQTHAEALTFEAIEQNLWHAVARDLPGGASAGLAAAVVIITDELSDRATKWGNRTDDDKERRAWHALAEMAERRGEKASTLSERILAVNEPEISRAAAAETLTVEAIRQDPWNAVRLDIPEDVSIELLQKISSTARELRGYSEGRTEAARDELKGEEVERWAERAEAADFRLDDASLKLAEARAQEAWRAPAFSYQTIQTDPWTAVHLPIPEQAEPELLAFARNWASDLGRYAEMGGREREFDIALGEPLVNADKFSREQNIEAAAERVAVLDARLELSREQMTERHHEERQLERAGLVAEAFSSTLEQRQAGESARLDEMIVWSKGWSSVDVGRGFEGVTLRSEDMDKWLEAQRTVELAQEQERSRSHGDFLSGTLINSHFGASLARTTEMLLNVVIGYFVPEPELMPEQGRLASLAHAERSEAMEFETARRENAAALDAVNYEIDRHRPHVRPDELVRPDSIYERYPGLTRDENEGRAQQVESERAFYDTGIERSRSRGI